MSETTKKMKFHITITDNETGKTLHDADACAILGAINEGENTACVCMTNCGPFGLVSTLKGLKRAQDEIISKHPELDMMVEILHKLDKEPENQEENEEKGEQEHE